MSLANQTISDHEKLKIKQFMDQGLKIILEVEDLKGALTDLAKTLGEELNIKHALLMKALRAAHKQTLEDDKEALDTVEELLVLTGRA